MKSFDKVDILESFDPLQIEPQKSNLLDSLFTLFQSGVPSPVQDIVIPENRFLNLQVPSTKTCEETNIPLHNAEENTSLEDVSSNTQAYSSTINRNYWMRDETVKECYDCKQQFTTFRRY